MNDFNWRNKPRTTTSPPKNKHVVADPMPITFNGTTLLSGTKDRQPHGRIFKPKVEKS